MTTRRAPDLDAPFMAVVRGELDAADIPDGLAVTSIGARTSEGAPVTVDALGGPLTLEGVDVWQHILTFRALSSGLRVDYSS